MSSVRQVWMELNREAHGVCSKATSKLVELGSENPDPFLALCAAFLAKATQTLSGVNILYAHRLEEPAQALIRVLFELRINFDCFLAMATADTRDAVQRVADSMMLEKVKQARASQFAGMSIELQASLENHEKEIARRYTPAELKGIRKNGFTGVPIEQRAALTGHGAGYSIVYRNFSRNVHSTDYAESFLKSGMPLGPDEIEYLETRDEVAQYTALFSAVGMVVLANQFWHLDLDAELTGLRERQQNIQMSSDPTQ